MLWFASAGQQHPVFDVFTLLSGMFGLETRTSATCTTRWSPTSQPTSLTQAPLSTQARTTRYTLKICIYSVYYICIHYLYFCILYMRKNATVQDSILFNWNQTCPGKNKGEYGRKNATAQYFTYFGDSEGKPTTRRGWVVNCQVLFTKTFKSFWTEDILKTISFRDNGIQQRADPASCDQPMKLSVG